MKKTVLILISIAISYCAIAQSETSSLKVREVGVAFSDLNSFGINYKVGTKTALWRFNSLLLSGGNTDEESDAREQDSKNIGFGLKAGREYRKSISDKLELKYGFDLSYRYYSKTIDQVRNVINSSNSKQESTYHYSGINMVLGLNYVINDNFVFGVELLPGINYKSGKLNEPEYDYSTQTSKQVKTDVSGFTSEFSNSSALLSLAYRF